MNYLELVQRLAREAGASGTISTLVGVQEETLRLSDWINSAWIDIQSLHRDWGWMRTSMSFETTSGKAVYTPAEIGIDGDFGMWVADTFRNYVTANGDRTEVFMSPIGYEAWRDSYQYGALRYTTTRPMVLTITPDKSIGLGPTPSDGYTVTGDYYTRPINLTTDTDTPSMPDFYHMAIVWRALMYYASYEGAPEAYQRANVEYGRVMKGLASDRLPMVTFGGPLA